MSDGVFFLGLREIKTFKLDPDVMMILTKCCINSCFFVIMTHYDLSVSFSVKRVTCKEKKRDFIFISASLTCCFCIFYFILRHFGRVMSLKREIMKLLVLCVFWCCIRNSVVITGK